MWIMKPTVLRILYFLTWTWIPVTLSSFLALYDLRAVVSGYGLALINIADVAMASDSLAPIILALVTYFLNDLARDTLWFAMISAFLFWVIIKYMTSYGRVGFPQQALRLRRYGWWWVVFSLLFCAGYIVIKLLPLAQQLLIMGQIASVLTPPAFLAAITGVFGPLGTALTSLLIGAVALIKVIAFLRPVTVIGAAAILVVIFLAAYYCTSLALSFTVLPRLSAPLATHTRFLALLRRPALKLVGWFLAHGLDALKGPDAASIIADVVEQAAPDASSAS